MSDPTIAELQAIIADRDTTIKSLTDERNGVIQINLERANKRHLYQAVYIALFSSVSSKGGTVDPAIVEQEALRCIKGSYAFADVDITV